MMSATTTNRRREAAREAALAAATARLRATQAIATALAQKGTYAQLVEWNGPKGEEYAVFELDSAYNRTSDYPVSTGTYESERALALTYPDPPSTYTDDEATY